YSLLLEGVGPTSAGSGPLAKQAQQAPKYAYAIQLACLNAHLPKFGLFFLPRQPTLSFLYLCVLFQILTIKPRQPTWSSFTGTSGLPDCKSVTAFWAWIRTYSALVRSE